MNQIQPTLHRDLCFDDQGRDKLIQGISTIAKAVKSTLGPRGQTVLIESPSHTHGITVTKDGVTVAKAVQLKDAVENLAVQMMRGAADRTASQAGDGTTTAIVLTEAIVKAGIKKLTSSHNSTEVIKYIKKETEKVIEALTKQTKKLTKKRLLDVATISCNNDSDIGSIISETYQKVGKNGIVTVEKSDDANTYYDVTNGMKIDRGYSSPLFVNNQKKDECILEDVHILVADQEINNILSIENVLKPIINNNHKLLIIGTCTQNLINTLAANVMKNNLQICSIIPPQFGYKQHELMSDIALAVGATYFSEKTGDDLSHMRIEDLGKAKKVIVGRDSTIIIKDKNNDDQLKDRVKELWEQHKTTKQADDREFVLQRIAGLTGGIGVIYVGANSDVEQKEKFDRVDDAVCAVRSALEEGILPGGGLALFRVADAYGDKPDEKNIHHRLGVEILSQALQEPFFQILINTGKNPSEMTNDIIDSGGYDVKLDVYGDMFELGIVDPLKVTKKALRNAVSVATTILSTNAIITLARHEK